MGESSRHAGALPFSSDKREASIGEGIGGPFSEEGSLSILDRRSFAAFGSLPKNVFQNFASTVSFAFCHAHEQGTVRNFDLSSYRSE